MSLIADGCGKMGFDPTPEQLTALVRYTHEVLRWGRRMNLTGVKDTADFARGHVLDSLATLPHLHIASGSRWADVGSGAGVPGIPLAILKPDSHWILVEPRQKRWAFLVHVVHHLGLQNITLHCERIDAAEVPENSLDGVVSRALGGPTLSTHPWLKPGGVIGLYAGADVERWDTEAASLPLEPQAPVTLSVPGIDAPRRLVWFKKTRACSHELKRRRDTS